MRQLNIHFISKMLGLMLILETFFILLSALVAFRYNGNDVNSFLFTALVACGLGAMLYSFGFRANEASAGKREGMITVTLTWIIFCIIGALPYYYGGYIPSFTDAFFETMSGFTTTGSTILADIEALPNGILFWRSLTQWQGGIGMVVFTVALLPLFGVGAAQLYDAETSGITHDRFRPRVTQVAKRLWGTYVFLTLILTVLLYAGPMTLFDSINHAFTCMATGGYSTKNSSVAYWDSAYIDYILSLFMFIGATNFTLIFFLMQGNVKQLFKDEELRWFFILIVSTIAVTTGWLMFKDITPDFEMALREATFQVVTLASTTGFATEDFNLWGSFFWMIALILMIICGCAGSTSGGLKMGRFMILCKSVNAEFKKQTHPHAVIPIRVNGNAISQHVVHRVLSFAVIYMVVLMVGCLILTFNGMDYPDAMGSVASAMGNVGPGFGSVGPVNNFSHIPDASKWTLSFVMMVGRLELFTILTLFSRGFWKQ